MIPIEITFTNGHAKITIKDWENQNVKPEESESPERVLNGT